MDIVESAVSLKTVFLAQNLTTIAMLHPSAPILTWHRQLSGLGPGADIPVQVFSRGRQDGLQFSATQILAYVQSLPSESVRMDLLSGPMILGAVKIGNLLEQHHLIRPNQALTQFAKHFRNAAAHGDKWNFKSNEPKYSAYTRDVEVVSSFHGTRATFETVGPFEYIRYLDEIAAYACQVAIDETVQIVYRKRGTKSFTEVFDDLQHELERKGVRCKDQSVQADIALYAHQIANGVRPIVSVTPTNYPEVD